MKNMAILMLLGITLFFSDFSVSASKETSGHHVATCTGSKNCNACKNCKYCGHCKGGGGTCGVCSSSVATFKTTIAEKKPVVKEESTSASSQCKGTTKKGARCKRMVKGGGYCWQHS